MSGDVSGGPELEAARDLPVTSPSYLPPDESPVATVADARPWWRRSPVALAIALVALVALLASVTSLGNGFAYDDRWIISANTRIQDPARWWRIFTESYWPVLSMGLYRPLTTLGYLLEWWAAGGRPWLFHLVNVGLYVAGAVAAFRLAGRTLPLAWAAAAALLYAAHPVHVEAVANGVGQAELWCFLVLAVATERYVAWRADGSLGADARHPAWGRVGQLALLYIVASLFKEQGIVLPGLLVAAELTVVDERRGLGARIAAVRPVVVTMALLTLFLFMVRVRIIGAITGDTPHPVIEFLPASERIVGMLGLVPEVMRLLLLPAHLSADYGPSHVIFQPDFGVPAAQGLLILALIALVTVASWRRAPAVAFGVLWAAVTYAPVSNVAFPSGILIAERTLLNPSLGVVIAVVALVEWGWREGKVRARELRLLAGIGGALLVAGTAFSAVRQPVWKDNDTIFHQMVKDAPLSARAHHALGGHYFEFGKNIEGEREWRIGIALDPQSKRLAADLADQYARAGLWRPAIELYRSVLVKEPIAVRSRAGLARALAAMGDTTAAVHEVYRGFGWVREESGYAQLAYTLREIRKPKPTPTPRPPAPGDSSGTVRKRTTGAPAGV